MPSWLPSIPYSDDHSGFWDPVTSTLNWCEEDYYATHYAAEIVNTLTNILFMSFAYIGISNCLTHGHDQIFLVAFVGYLLVGTGSFLFHATLKYPMQLVDELSMIYTTCLMCYATFGYARSQGFRIRLAAALFSLAGGVTAYYHYLQDPKFHQSVYAALTVVIVLRSLWVMEVTLRPWWKGEISGNKGVRGAQSNGSLNAHGGHAESVRPHKSNAEILRTMWILIAFGLTTFLTGFFIWHLDSVYCSQLRSWRRELGLPWGIVLEGHGWWHLLTGTGAYCYIVWGIWLRHCLNGRQDEFDLRWSAIWSLPEVVRIKNWEGNGVPPDKKLA